MRVCKEADSKGLLHTVLVWVRPIKDENCLSLLYFLNYFLLLFVSLIMEQFIKGGDGRNSVVTIEHSVFTGHTVASPPCSIHLGKKFLIPNYQGHQAE